MSLEVEVGPIATRADQRRQEIADAAASLFDRSGYATASMGEIAQAVGLAKPTLYHYFANKDEILFTIHEQFITTLSARLDAREDRPTSPSDRLRAVIEDVFTIIDTHQGHVRVFFEHYRELPLEKQQAIRAKRDAYEARVHAVVLDGMAMGEFRAVEPRFVVLALFGMCNWAYQWYRPGGPLSASDLAERFSSYLIDGLAQGEVPDLPRGN